VEAFSPAPLIQVSAGIQKAAKAVDLYEAVWHWIDANRFFYSKPLRSSHTALRLLKQLSESPMLIIQAPITLEE